MTKHTPYMIRSAVLKRCEARVVKDKAFDRIQGTIEGSEVKGVPERSWSLNGFT